jgi:hypothetical protein
MMYRIFGGFNQAYGSRFFVKGDESSFKVGNDELLIHPIGNFHPS